VGVAGVEENVPHGLLQEGRCLRFGAEWIQAIIHIGDPESPIEERLNMHDVCTASQ
jgi:hypothetical protein